MLAQTVTHPNGTPHARRNPNWTVRPRCSERGGSAGLTVGASRVVGAGMTSSTELRTPLLPPTAESDEELPWYKDVAVWGAVGNVSMTMIGTVVLSLPAAVAVLG